MTGPEPGRVVKTGMDPHVAAHMIAPVAGLHPHYIANAPWLLMCAVPLKPGEDGTMIVDMVIVPSQVDHIETLAQMCDIAADRLRATIRLDIPDHPPL